MEKIIKPRGSGKTFDLIKRSLESGDYIVCHSMDEAGRVFDEASKNGYHIRYPLTYDEFHKKQYYAPNISGFLIDNVEMFLQSLTHVKINAITLTDEEE